MSEKKHRAAAKPPDRKVGQPWRVPVVQTDVPESGLHLDLAADEKVRGEIARLADLPAVPRLEASFDVTRHGRGGLHVVGWVSATVDQICGVTLEPMQNEIHEAVDVVFVPATAESRYGRKEVAVGLEDMPEPLVDGTIDLGAIATEFLILGINPYPRKPGIEFDAPSTAEASGRPFAALAALKKGHPSG
jgi:uncharacterized metal-binding protein YceD (DUF177 family)